MQRAQQALAQFLYVTIWKKLSLRTLMAIRAKCDMEICISHASSLPSVISAFCLLELVGPLQGDKETDAK